MKIKEKKKAISLIVLVITVIVLSILAATVIVSISDTDVISETNKVAFKADMANYKEIYEMYVTKETLNDISFDKDALNLKYGDGELNDIFNNLPDKYKENFAIIEGELAYITENDTEKEILEALGIRSSDAISRTKSYVGYYADTDGDGEVEGIIYSDSRSSDAKDYVISQSSYTVEGAPGFKEYPVIKVKDGQEDKADRFGVWEFSVGFGGYWYYNAYEKNVGTTNLTPGSGKENTQKMIEIGNAGTYGALSSGDIWYKIQNTESKYSYSNGWFVPSRSEYAAIREALKLHGIGSASYNSNYYLEDYKLCGYAWTSNANIASNGVLYTATLVSLRDGGAISDGVGAARSMPGYVARSTYLATTF